MHTSVSKPSTANCAASSEDKLGEPTVQQQFPHQHRTERI